MQTKSVNGPAERTVWQAIDWHQANRRVRNLRRRIFRASRDGDLAKVRSLQKLALRSHSVRLKAVRTVTQENAGRLTPGVDKLVVKTAEARTQLVDALGSHQLSTITLIEAAVATPFDGLALAWTASPGAWERGAVLASVKKRPGSVGASLGAGVPAVLDRRSTRTPVDLCGRDEGSSAGAEPRKSAPGRKQARK